ncbi:MAG TPA: hypothetical protein VFG23_15035 [Polyangia bacterium]|nr:hypothetical protein [Polyangia bacterium]
MPLTPSFPHPGRSRRALSWLSRSRPGSWLWLAVALSVTCASTNPNAAKYPPRQKGCHVRVFYSPIPEVKEWDDLGMASVDCYLDVGAVQCLARLRQEACRMGGDLLYDVPKKALRPTEQGMSYRGHVAHTRQKPDEKADDDDKDQPPENTGPVEPIAPVTPLPPPAPADAGAPSDGPRA